MRKILHDEIITVLKPYLDGNALEDVKMKITLILNDYNIEQSEHALVVYEEDKTTVMIKRFLAAKIAAGRSKRTLKFYKYTLEFFFRRVQKPYDEITADDVRYYLAMRMHQDGVSKTHANNERRNLSSFYTWLQKEEVLLKNPMNKVDIIKETKKKKKAFTHMEIEKLRAACRTNREKAMIEVLISTWCRVYEFANIRISNIKDNQIKVLGKGDKERIVYLTPKAQLAVERYLNERSDSNPYLFPRAKYAGNIWKFASEKGSRTSPNWYKNPELVAEDGHMEESSTVRGILNNIAKRAGVENVHPHRFRRTGATFALSQGMPIIQVSKLLGHNDLNTTQIYLDISDEELMRGHEKYVT